MRLGAHVPAARPLEHADRQGLEVVQLHLSSPRMWKPPKVRGDAAVLAAGGRVATVHAPYLCNPASADPEVRRRTTILLQATLDAATSVGAGGVVVHAGQAGPGGSVDEAVSRWGEVHARLTGSVPLLIENTASGQASAGRYLDDLARLFAHLRERVGTVPIGACLDTAHAFAGDPAAAADPGGWVERFREVTGGVDVVHVNDSAVEAGAGRDRHTNLGAGQMGLARMAAMLEAARSEVMILETPGDVERRRQDVEILRFLVESGI